MNLPSTSKQVAMSAESPSEEQTRLSGRWLVIARSVWSALVALSLVVFVVSVPAYFLQILHSSPQQMQALEHVGLSPLFNALFNIILIVATALVCFALAALIFWRKSADWLTLLVSLMLIMQGVAGTEVLVGPLEHSTSIWSWPAFFLDFFSGFLVGLVFWFFPDGRLAPRWLLWPIIAYIAGFVALAPTLIAPLALPAPSWLGLLGVLLLAGAALALIIAQVYRYRHLSGPVQRQQAKWAVSGLGLSMTAFAAGYLPSLVFPSLSLSSSLYGLIFAPIWTCAPLVLPVSIGIAILRYRLWDIDIIINRTLVYGTLTGLLALVYFGLIFALQSLFQGMFHQNNDVAIVVSTLVIAALFQPLRHRIQRIIDRRFYRSKYDAAKIVEAFSETLRQEVDLDQLHDQLLAVVQETMQPTHISLWLRKPERDGKRSSGKTNALISHSEEMNL